MILLPPPSPTGIVGKRHHDCWKKTILSLPLPLPREYLEQKAERLSQGSQRTSDQSDLHSPESLGFIAVCCAPPPIDEKTHPWARSQSRSVRCTALWLQ